MASIGHTSPAQRSALCTANDHRTGVLSLVSEFAGTFALLFAAVSAIRLTAPGAVLAGVNDALPHGRLLVIGVAVGGAVGAFALTPLARCSGAHLNPAITLMLHLRREVTRRELATYVLAQLAGSLAAVGAARLLWGAVVATPSVEFGLIQPGPGWDGLATAAGELVMTALLLAGVLATRRDARLRPWGPLLIGALIATMIWIGGAWNGGSFNPARNLAPAVFSGDWGDQFEYLAVPLLAGVLLAATPATAWRGVDPLSPTPPLPPPQRSRSVPVAKPE